MVGNLATGHAALNFFDFGGDVGELVLDTTTGRAPFVFVFFFFGKSVLVFILWYMTRERMPE